MTRKVLRAACLITLAHVAGASEPPRQSFECDTPPGHFSYWNRTVTTATITVNGKLAVNELRKDGKWSPTALVVLKSPDGKAGYGVHLYTVPKIKDIFFLEIVTPGGNEKLGLGLVPATKDPLPFSVQLDGGQLRVSLAGLEASAAAGDFKPASLRFSCSTGDFEFQDFVVRE